MINKILSFEYIIEKSHIGEFPIKYQAIEGLVRTKKEVSEMVLPKLVSVEAYFSDKYDAHLFYKPISKMF